MDDLKVEQSPVTAAPLFDASKEFEIHILSGGEKVCLLRYPTDAEWCDWVRKQRSVRQPLGRGASQTKEIGLEKASAELLDRIRKDRDGVAFDGAEAVKAIGRLDRSQVLSVEREGDDYHVTMKAAGVSVLHVLRMPTAEEVLQYERGSTDVRNVARAQEIRARLEPAGVLYDAIHRRHEGYTGAVPITHKSTAACEVIGQMYIDEGDEVPES